MVGTGLTIFPQLDSLGTGNSRTVDNIPGGHDLTNFFRYLGPWKTRSEMGSIEIAHCEKHN